MYNKNMTKKLVKMDVLRGNLELKKATGIGGRSKP